MQGGTLTSSGDKDVILLYTTSHSAGDVGGDCPDGLPEVISRGLVPASPITSSDPPGMQRPTDSSSWPYMHPTLGGSDHRKSLPGRDGKVLGPR